MAAGQVHAPMILAMDHSLVIEPKSSKVQAACVFQIDPKCHTHKIFFTVNNGRPTAWDLPKKLAKMTMAQRETLLYKEPFRSEDQIIRI